MIDNLTNPTLARETNIVEKQEAIPLAEERDLWAAFKSGNNSAFILIYERFFDSLYSYGLRINSDEDLIKDAIHDIFLDLKKNSSSLGDTDSIKFYLFKCLKRRIFREVKNWANLRENLDMRQSFEITFSHEQTLIDKQIDREKTEEINAAIRTLSPRKREAIYYVFYEGMSYQQVSELMELSDAKSARDLVYKGLKCLRDTLGFLPAFILPFH
ncbi:sigma-70 family RNA polymerase sigma factor [Algoriphagus aestuariicola]|uniref:Sigma-70 family RNA polymerase sigma factor n=1 Tax=Algoriphagus aestuariicola TaxID=1852016 RepID=A0ABS3BLQ9_9BACT|nr:sigma-70 family RNA polymerase sigma factor [Algoriphagus aestuariicola]MBN7800247.1 sigma-70 family RNA polymerase sigma factor [Algoriphagus aestuariicola]